jgi:hypothetical protein
MIERHLELIRRVHHTGPRLKDHHLAPADDPAVKPHALQRRRHKTAVLRVDPKVPPQRDQLRRIRPEDGDQRTLGAPGRQRGENAKKENACTRFHRIPLSQGTCQRRRLTHRAQSWLPPDPIFAFIVYRLRQDILNVGLRSFVSVVGFSGPFVYRLGHLILN